jgi:hypothetical protein
MVFACVNDRAPATSLELLREACRSRGVEYREIDARQFDYDPARRLALGDLLFRVGTSISALRVEQFLFAPGVATFYAGDEDRVFFTWASQWLLFERAGIPVPPTVFCGNANHAQLERWVQRLGGFPVIAKMGGTAGVGVIMLDSPAALYSFVEYALSLGRPPALCAYIRDAVHWRVVVVRSRVIAAYTCEALPGDFRAVAPNSAGIFTKEPPPVVAALAANAVRATRLELGGVDIVERADGSYVLESNFPFYFPHAQVEGGIDVAGAMLDHLLAKAAATTGRADRAYISEFSRVSMPAPPETSSSSSTATSSGGVLGSDM